MFVFVLSSREALMYSAEQLSTTPEQHKIPIDERVLSDVNHLVATVLPDGGWPKQVETDITQNLETSIQELSMPFAVTKTRHNIAYDPETDKRVPMWLGTTAVRSAMSGYKFHYHPNARRRVDIEVDEARYATDDLEAGVMKFFISPRMSPEDATKKDAEREHLANDDAVRASWIEYDKNGQPTTHVMQSLLVRDVPLSAWVAMLRDPNNIFGKALDVTDEGSALSVMRLHRELELPVGVVDGPVGLLEEVVKYIDDPSLRTKVERQIGRYYEDQDVMAREAKHQASEWLAFEKQLALSLIHGTATSEVCSFIVRMQHEWNDDELDVIRQHATTNAGYTMTRSLAVVLEKLKQNVLSGVAGVAVGNQDVINQLSPIVLRQVRINQEQIRLAQIAGQDYSALTRLNQRLIASEAIEVRGGCTGNNNRRKAAKPGLENPLDTNVLGYELDVDLGQEDSASRSNWKWKRGVCRVEKCSTRPGKTKVGPCDVCEKCQNQFDHGVDPTKTAEPKMPQLFGGIFSLGNSKANQAATDKTPFFNFGVQLLLMKEPDQQPKQELVRG